MHRFVFPLLFVGAWVSAQAQRAQVYPRIETGTHTASVHGIDVDAAERFLFSASSDKTVRVWDLQSGKLLKILRPPIGPGDEGKLYAVAASPDGAMVAVGGYIGAGDYTSVYIFDPKSGAIRKTISNLPGATEHLAYSKDGRYLAVALQLITEFASTRLLTIRKLLEMRSIATAASWAEFDGLGRLVTAS